MPPIDPLEDKLIESSSLKQIRTFQGDVAEALKKDNASINSIREKEVAKNDLLLSSTAPNPERDMERKKRLITLSLLGAGILLIILGGVGSWYSYKSYKAKTASPIGEIPPNRFLPAQSVIETPELPRADFINFVTSEREKPLNEGETKEIEIKKNPSLITTTEFWLLLEARPGASLVRAFDPLFMFGILGGAPNESFIIVKLDSFENAYAGMLDWESNMKADLLSLFKSGTFLANVSTTAEFQDIAIKNKDARVLLDQNGKSVLIYSFYNQSYLIITGSESALRTLITKLDRQALAR